MAHATTPVVTGLLRALRRNAELFGAEWAAARQGDPDAIHQLRVASRRLRLSLQLAGEAADVRVNATRRMVGRVTRAFGEVRQLDVTRGILESIAADGPWAASAVTYVDNRCARMRRKALASARRESAEVDLTKLRARIEAAAQELAQAAPSDAATVAVLATISRRLRHLSDALREAGTVYGVDALHQARLCAKKLRYALEGGSGALGLPARRLAQGPLKRLQQRLGALHDLQVLQQYVRAAVARGTSVQMAADLARMDQVIELDCRKRHARIIARRPGVDRALAELRREVAKRMAQRDLRKNARIRPAADRSAASGF